MGVPGATFTNGEDGERPAMIPSRVVMDILIIPLKEAGDGLTNLIGYIVLPIPSPATTI
jgi:hypothetical protein